MSRLITVIIELTGSQVFDARRQFFVCLPKKLYKIITCLSFFQWIFFLFIVNLPGKMNATDFFLLCKFVQNPEKIRTKTMWKVFIQVPQHTKQCGVRFFFPFKYCTRSDFGQMETQLPAELKTRIFFLDSLGCWKNNGKKTLAKTLLAPHYFQTHHLIGMRRRLDSYFPSLKVKMKQIFWSTRPTQSHGRLWSMFSQMFPSPLFKILQNKCYLKIMIATVLVGTVGLAEGIIDDTSLVLVQILKLNRFYFS